MNDDKNDSEENNYVSEEESLSNEIKLTLWTEENEIKQYIINKLMHFNIINENIISLIKRKYSDFHTDYFLEYYPINSKWIENFLQLYNYEKISRLIKKQSNGELKVEELEKQIHEKNILKLPGEDNERKNKLKWIEFSPKKAVIPKDIYYDDISEKTIEFFDDFILVNKELYNEIRKDSENGYEFNIENKINICLVDNIFLYKIYDNILGIGILPELSTNIKITIFKIQFLIIIYDEEGCDLNLEINVLFREKDLEKYLKYRGAKFHQNNNLKINIYEGEKIIGFIYNFGNFKIEDYWKRNEESLLKKMEREKVEKEKEREKQREIQRQLIREKELKEQKRIKEIERQKQIKEEKERKEILEKQKKFLAIMNIERERKRDIELLKKKIEKEKLKKLEKFSNKKYISNNNKFGKDKDIKNEINDDIKEENIIADDSEKKILNVNDGIYTIESNINIKTFSDLQFVKNINCNTKKKDKHQLQNNLSLPSIKPRCSYIQTESAFNSINKKVLSFSSKKKNLTTEYTNFTSNNRYNNSNNKKENNICINALGTTFFNNSTSLNLFNQNNDNIINNQNNLNEAKDFKDRLTFYGNINGEKKIYLKTKEKEKEKEKKKRK